MESTNKIIESWKNPKRNNLMTHPSGKAFQELSNTEMEFVAGGNGTVDPQLTPSTLLCAKISIAVSAAGVSFVGSFIASAAFDCND